MAVGLIMSLSVGGVAVGWRYVEEDAREQGASSIERTPPTLAKEYIYAGSRIVAVENAGTDSSDKAESVAGQLSGGLWRGQDEAGSQRVSKGRATSGDLFMP
ncbi:MAG TPA: hypothetical protein VN256_27045 [Pyrinomonadaceae bacterium]|nr:hypothetical protein [Pyrinomonadaceae bacterium]